MTGESGYVASEGFPNLYPPNKKCIWTITVRWLPLVTIALYQSPKPNPDSSGNCLLFGHKGGRPTVTRSEAFQPSSSLSTPTTGN